MFLKDKPWNRELQLALTALIAINVLPHVMIVPLWATAFSGFAITWKLLYLTHGFQLPKRWVVSLIGFLATLVALSYFGSLLGSAPAGALLVILVSLKLLETHRYRDAMLVVFACYFLLILYLLEESTLVATAFMLFDLVVLTLMLLALHQTDFIQYRRLRHMMRFNLRFLIILLPIWIFLYVAFPRFSSSIAGLNPVVAPSGFSDELNPGSIEKLLDSSDVAFRVRFHERVKNRLDPQSFYYRGAILTEGDGLRWKSRSRSQRLEKNTGLELNSQRSWVADLWLEPGFDRWIFTPDHTLELKINDPSTRSKIKQRTGLVYFSNEAVLSRIHYQAIGQAQYPTGAIEDAELESNLRLPPNRSREFNELVSELTRMSEDRSRLEQIAKSEADARVVIDWFLSSRFRYTKEPGPMGPEVDGMKQLDVFLFQRKVGFCEHFAAAFATLVRAMGTPARVVVGFQGGTPNTMGDYWLLRNLDAHAWAEIWVSEQEPRRGRWLRFDPTATIAPLRMQLGGDFYNVDPTFMASGLSGEEIRRSLDSGWAAWLNRAAFLWDMAQMRWNAFLIDYDLQYQLDLLRRLGLQIDTNSKSVWILGSIALIGAALLAIFVSLVWQSGRRRSDPILKEWQRFCTRLSAYNLERKQNEGPLAFAKRLSSRWPEKSAEIQLITQLFIDLRYGASPPGTARRDEVARFKRAIQAFSIEDKSF